MNHPAPNLTQSVSDVLPGLLKPLGIELHLELAKRNSLSQTAPAISAQFIVDGKKLDAVLWVGTRINDQLLNQAAMAARLNDAIMIIVVPRLRSSAQQLLRGLGLNFADLTGTISLRAPGIRIDVQGTESPPAGARRSAKQEVNPFSKKASILLRTLCESFRKKLSTPELAESTSLSRGWISGVLNELVSRGYATISESGVALSNPAGMLRDWIRAYQWTRNTGQQYVTPFGHDEIVNELRRTFKQHHVIWALTLTAGAIHRLNYAPYDAVTQAYAYAEDSENVMSALASIHAVPVRDGGNLLLFSPPYYGKATFIGAATLDHACVVSDVQLFLDLAHFPVRGAELAETLVRSRLAKQFDFTPAETKTLIEAFA